MALTHNKHLAFYVIKYENDVLDEAVTTGERLSISRTTLWHWVKRRYIIPIEIGGKQRYKLSDVNAILKGDNEVFKEAWTPLPSFRKAYTISLNDYSLYYPSPSQFSPNNFVLKSHS